MQVIATQNTDVNVHAVHCDALHSTCNFSNSATFSNFVSKFMQTLFPIKCHLKNMTLN